MTFKVRRSAKTGVRTACVLPDIATCAECLAEISNPGNRRYRYPFTNCTNCGPRYTMVATRPYDRESTTKRSFSMCEWCQAEYDNPFDRRFHAQPNACSECGPQLELWDESGLVLAERHQALIGTIRLLKAGGIVAVKGLGGFHLFADASNRDAVARLRERKQREEKPFAVMTPGIEWARELCAVGTLEERALQSPECPIVLLERIENAPPFIASTVAPNNPCLGIMLPSTPLHHLLMQEMDGPVVATSGNRGGEPLCKDERIALENLSGVADAFLVHNRPIRRHVDDSIVRILLGGEQVLRRARGYAPLPMTLEPSSPSHLAAGEGCGDQIQHHSAHVAACMADNALQGPVLGVAWDGSGYGADGTIWGGEFLLVRHGAFTRVAHLRTFPLPGGDASTRRPRHTAAGLLFEILGERAWRAGDPPLLSQMLREGTRSPRTSSAGRLFDAVASLAGIRHEATYEGQAAMELEFAIDKTVEDAYPFLIQETDPLVVDWEPMLLRILDDVSYGILPGIIAARFHNSLAEMILAVATCIAEPKVALTGDCFQNRYLTERTVRRLREAGFQPYWHQRVPPNDGGIALGQVAAALLMDGSKKTGRGLRGFKSAKSA